MRSGGPDFAALRPALGPRADALELAWISAKPEERTEIEIVAELLRRQVSSPRSVLLHPPTGDQADGPIRLGQILHGDRALGWLGLHEGELLQHLGVFGRSGSGKSTLCLKVLLQLLERNIPFVVFDFKRSARALRRVPHGDRIAVVSLGRDIGATLAFNPLSPPPGVGRDEHQRQLVELISDSWLAGPGVISILERAMTECYQVSGDRDPTIADVHRVVEAMNVKAREALWRQSALRILAQMTTGPLGRILTRRSDAKALHQLRTGFTIVELDGLASSDAAFLTQHIMRFLTQCLLADRSRERLRLVCLVEEAHHLLAKREGSGGGGGEPVLETCLREGREVGLGIMIVDQSPSQIAPVALANRFTTIVFNCRQRTDVSTAAGSLLLEDDQRDLLGLLPVGQAVARLSDRWPHAVHIQAPPLDLPKGQVSDQDVADAFVTGPYGRLQLDGPGPPLIEQRLGDSAGSAHSATNRGPDAKWNAIPARPVPADITTMTDSRALPQDREGSSSLSSKQIESRFDGDIDLPPEARLLLEHVATAPLTSVTSRYATLGLSRRKGDAAKRVLVDEGYLKPIDVAIPTGQLLLLELTDTARLWLQRRRIEPAATQGSLLHAWWQQHAAELLRAAGWTVALEHRIGGHAFDIHAERAGNTLLLEVETGRSDYLGNLAALESATSDRRWVLWLDTATLLRIRSLAPKSVKIVQPRELARLIAALGGEAKEHALVTDSRKAA